MHPPQASEKRRQFDPSKIEYSGRRSADDERSSAAQRILDMFAGAPPHAFVQDRTIGDSGLMHQPDSRGSNPLRSTRKSIRARPGSVSFGALLEVDNGTLEPQQPAGCARS
jgi:hypothetical protein